MIGAVARTISGLLFRLVLAEMTDTVLVFVLSAIALILGFGAFTLMAIVFFGAWMVFGSPPGAPAAIVSVAWFVASLVLLFFALRWLFRAAQRREARPGTSEAGSTAQAAAAILEAAALEAPSLRPVTASADDLNERIRKLDERLAPDKGQSQRTPPDAGR